MRRTVLYTLFILLAAAMLGAGFSNEKRSEYIISIATYVEWPEYASADSFHVGIITKDSLLANELKKNLSKATIKQMPVSVSIFTQVSQLHRVDLLYFNQKDSVDAAHIYEHPATNSTLLVTENYPFQKSMFNFIVVDGKRKFELNEYRLSARGFKVDPLFSAMAIRNKADWENLYQRSELDLEKERQVVRSQKGQIAQQESQISYQEAEIEQQQNRISSQREFINTQKSLITEQKHSLSELAGKIKETEQELIVRQNEIESRKAIIIAQKKDALQWSSKAQEQKQLLDQLDSQVQEQQSVMITQLNAIERQRLIIGLFAVLSVLICVMTYLIFRALQQKKRSNAQLHEKNEYITQQNEEISQQRDKITEQNAEITDSIHYASNIQAAMLPSHEIIDGAGAESFILYRPRDIVSGDFYWAVQKDNCLYVSAADCTGHGVPGAFMSMLGITFLNEIVIQDGVCDTGKIVTRLRQSIVSALNKRTDTQRRDGMDMGLCKIDTQRGVLQFSGANNHCYLVRNGNLETIKADKMPVGLSDLLETPFTSSEIELQENDCLYLYTDGFHDQFGGPDNKKFMSKRLKELLTEIASLPMREQKIRLETAMDQWMGYNDQIDDILVIGIRFDKWKTGTDI